MSVRLLFRVTEKKELINQTGGTEKLGSVKLLPVYPSKDAPNYEEQASFYKWTPSGHIEFATINEAALASGAMVAGMLPAPTAAAEVSRERPPAVVEKRMTGRRRREHKRKGTTRRQRIRELEPREAMGTLSREAQAELAWLRRMEQIARGRLGRRMRRQRVWSPLATFRRLKVRRTRSAPTLAQLRGERIPRAFRAVMLRQEGRPVSGRQWRQFRKAARRQERAS